MPAAVTDEPFPILHARARRVAGLYAVTPDFADTPALTAAVEAALKGGASAIQYRNKTAAPDLRRTQAWALARILATRGGLLIVNDDAALAAEVGADGVHIGGDDGAIEAAREKVGPDRIVGVSCYNDSARARAAAAAGADYLAFGSFFASTVKPDARRAELTLLQNARELGLPLVAIGGITAGNAQVLRQAGADAVAVISAVFGARDPDAIEAAARSIAVIFPRGASSRVEHA